VTRRYSLKRGATTNLLLVVIATVVATLAAEALARVLGVWPTLGQPVSVRGVATRTVDGVPLWSDKYPRYDGDDLRRMANDRDAFKIIGLGDSILYGVLQPKEGTYLEQVRHALASRMKRRVEILNMAVPGYNTRQEDAVFKEVEDQIKPNLVLVHYWEDDAHQYRAVGGYVVDVGNISEEEGHVVVRALPLPPLLSDFLLVHSRFYDLLTQAVLGYHRTRTVGADSWTNVSEPLADIQERAQRAGGRLLVLASPELNGPAPTPNGDLPRLQQLAASQGFEVIDVSEWLRGTNTSDIALDGCHFNAKGHAIIGEHLADYLLQHDLKE